jgi:hypothetical protein
MWNFQTPMGSTDLLFPRSCFFLSFLCWFCIHRLRLEVLVAAAAGGCLPGWLLMFSVCAPSCLYQPNPIRHAMCAVSCQQRSRVSHDAVATIIVRFRHDVPATLDRVRGLPSEVREAHKFRQYRCLHTTHGATEMLDPLAEYPQTTCSGPMSVPVRHSLRRCYQSVAPTMWPDMPECWWYDFRLNRSRGKRDSVVLFGSTSPAHGDSRPDVCLIMPPCDTSLEAHPDAKT